MIIGINPPGLSYIGPHSEDLQASRQIDSFVDLLSVIKTNLHLNEKIDISNTCIDVSLFNFTQNFFTEVIDEESPEISNVITEINLHLAKRGSRVFFYLNKDYFLGTQLDAIEKLTTSLILKLSEVLEALGVNYPSILIRVGSAYGNRKNTMDVFCQRALQLGKSTLSRLCVMNDDKPSLFSVTDLLSGIYYRIKVPICFRVLPHQFNDGGLSIREALFLSCSTWDPGLKPIIIHSESILIDEFGLPLDPKSSDYLSHRIPTFGMNLDVIIDSPTREDSCLKYRMDYKSLPPIVIGRKN